MKKVSLYLLILTVLIVIISGIIWAEESAAPVADGTFASSGGTTWSLSETPRASYDLGYSHLSGLAVPEYHRKSGDYHRRRPRDDDHAMPFDDRVGFVLLVTALAIIVAFGSDSYYE